MSQQAKSKSIQCVNCGHDNLSTAKTCVVCGIPLTYTSRFENEEKVPTGILSVLEQRQSTTKPDDADSKLPDTQPADESFARSPFYEESPQASIKTDPKCPDCGYLNRVGDYFCAECGRHLLSAKEKDSPADVTQEMKALTTGSLQAEIARQQAPQPVEPIAPVQSSLPPDRQFATSRLQKIGDKTIPDGYFQFTEQMFLRFTSLESGRYAEIVPTLNKPLLIGRSHNSLPVQPDLDLTPFLSEQHGVSRRHALIRWRDQRLEMQDLDSTNGTGINGFRFHPKETHEVRNGDIINFGRVTVKVGFMSKETNDTGNVTEKLDL